MSLKNIFVDIVLFPVYCMAYAIMLFHRLNPDLWRCCVRPVINRLRKTMNYCYAKTGKISNKTNLFRPLVSVFNNEIITILRLIRLEAEEEFHIKTNNFSQIKKKSMVA